MTTAAEGKQLGKLLRAIAGERRDAMNKIEQYIRDARRSGNARLDALKPPPLT